MEKEIQKVAMTSADPVQDKLPELRKIIPEAFAEDKIDWDKLKSTLGGDLEAGIEKYGLNWAGKSNAFKAIRVPATGTLVPQGNESKNWDKTENLFIEGDNLEVLKLLQKHYRGQIKMIYIDPPYNTGKDFIYKDNFTENTSDYYERTGQSKDGIKLSSNMEANGRYHSDWLTMMYPRLFLAKNLLKDDGVIFVSIDDHEVANLRMIMDEIFGEENFIDNIIWKKRYGGGAKEKYYVTLHEYVLVYAKNLDSINEITVSLGEESIDRYYTLRDENFETRGPFRTHPLEATKSMGDRPNLIFPIIAPDGSEVHPKRQWLWSKDRVDQAKMDGEIFFAKVGSSWTVSSKQYLKDKDGNLRLGKMQSLVDDVYSQHGTNEIIELFDNAQIFSFPKPTKLIKKFIDSISSKNDIVLDFFAGSGSTAHAVMGLNSEDNGERKFICVQIPEEIDEKSEAYKTGFKTIAEISRERIRRAGDKVGKGDIGFKSLKLEQSNYRQWNVITDKDDEQKLKAQMKLFAEKPLIDGYNEKAVVYEILTKEGFDLNAAVGEQTVGGMKMWVVSEPEKKIFVSFAKELTKEQVEDLKLTESDTFVCFDSALDDTTKVNLSRNFNVKVM